MEQNFFERNKQKIKNGVITAGCMIISAGSVALAYRLGFNVGAYSCAQMIYKFLDDKGCKEGVDIVGKVILSAVEK